MRYRVRHRAKRPLAMQWPAGSDAWGGGATVLSVMLNPKLLYVANRAITRWRCWTAATHSLVATIPVGAAPRGIVFNPAVDYDFE